MHLDITWVFVKIMVLFWLLIITRHLVLRGPKGEHHFDTWTPRVAGNFGKELHAQAGQRRLQALVVAYDQCLQLLKS